MGKARKPPTAEIQMTTFGGLGRGAAYSGKIWDRGEGGEIMGGFGALPSMMMVIRPLRDVQGVLPRHQLNVLLALACHGETISGKDSPTGRSAPLIRRH